MQPLTACSRSVIRRTMERKRNCFDESDASVMGVFVFWLAASGACRWYRRTWSNQHTQRCRVALKKSSWTSNQRHTSTPFHRVPRMSGPYLNWMMKLWASQAGQLAAAVVGVDPLQQQQQVGASTFIYSSCLVSSVFILQPRQCHRCAC